MAWGATEAKAKFSELLDRAEQEGPQVVRRRKHVYVVMTQEQHEAVPKVAKLLRNNEPVPEKHETLAEFFRNSPLGDLDLTHRPKLKPRRIEF